VRVCWWGWGWWACSDKDQCPDLDKLDDTIVQLGDASQIDAEAHADAVARSLVAKVEAHRVTAQQDIVRLQLVMYHYRHYQPR
jgi:hypothetical protein